MEWVGATLEACQTCCFHPQQQSGGVCLFFFFWRAVSLRITPIVSRWWPPHVLHILPGLSHSMGGRVYLKDLCSQQKAGMRPSKVRERKRDKALRSSKAQIEQGSISAIPTYIYFPCAQRSITESDPPRLSWKEWKRAALLKGVY